MFDHLVLNDVTRQQLQHFATRPSHALLLCGPGGIGKTAVARALAASILELDAQKFLRHAYARTVSPDERGTVTIEHIRGLQKFLQLKTTGRAAMRRAVIVEHADAMTLEAQNAFLKLLEEPPADTLIILTAANVRSLLPTIRSRVQTIALREPEQAQLAQHFKNAGKDQPAINQASLLSGGLPGLMNAILDGDSEHPLLAAINQAKKILSSPAFERLAAVDALAKQKDAANTLTAAMLRIAQAGQQQAAAKNDSQRLKQWHLIRKQALNAQGALQTNANTKLVLTNLMLQI